MLNQRIQGLYAITPDKGFDITLIENTINKHKVNILQYRRKNLDIKNKLYEANKLFELCKQHNTLFIINDDINLCQKIGADGIHIGQNDTHARLARKALGKKFIIGVTCHDSLELAIDAENNGADYIALGAIFKSINKPKATHCPLSKIKNIKKNINIPVVGIGGISLENQGLAYDAGCDAVAMIDGLFGH